MSGDYSERAVQGYLEYMMMVELLQEATNLLPSKMVTSAPPRLLTSLPAMRVLVSHVPIVDHKRIPLVNKYIIIHA